MTDDVSFSVSMCVYGKDNPAWFKTAVDSILHQTQVPSEIVLVVDGPVPAVLDKWIVEYERMPEFKVIRLPENRGHGEARRIGLENCSNELVALMDADDISLPDRFEKQLKIFAMDETLSIVGGNIAEFVGNTDNIVSQRVVPTTDDEIKAFMKKRCPMNQVTVMFRKADVCAAGGYVDWYCNEDYYLWLRMALKDMRFANVSDTIVYVRIGEEMYRRRGGWKYFLSEAKLQRYMQKNKVVGFGTYMTNVMKRLIVQVLLPNKLRGWAFKRFARTEA